MSEAKKPCAFEMTNDPKGGATVRCRICGFSGFLVAERMAFLEAAKDSLRHACPRAEVPKDAA
jgi:hypothetical protein